MNPQRLDLDYHIIWQGRWHVGSGYQSAAADRLLRRLEGVDGGPFVPGSQIKGVLRYQCERLALAFGLEAVNPHAGIKEDNQNLIRHFKPLKETTLVVDRLFGTRYQGECLFVTNAVPMLLPEEKTVPSVQPRTALDRLTGTVMEHNLFTTEFSDQKTSLQGTIRARHPAGVLTPYEEGVPYEYALLLVSLLSMDTLGGDKSTGLGRCSLEIVEDSLRWNCQDISLDAGLQSFEDLADEWAEWLEATR